MPLFPSLSPHFVYSPLFLLRGILSAPGRLLFPSPSVSLSHFASRPFFYLFCLYGSPPPSLLLSPRSSFLTTGSTLLGRMNAPPQLFADPQRELVVPSLCPWLLAARGASPVLSKCKGHLAGLRAGWDASADPMWGSVLRNLS